MNSFGRLFRIHIFGESHGASVGVVVDGCPAGIALGPDDFLNDLARRKSGSIGTTPRQEEDTPELVSGVFNGFTTGAPLTVIFRNLNTRSQDYAKLRETPRPGHADYTASVKFGGFEDYRGGGHFSGRLTLGLVAAGVVARKIIHPVTIGASLMEAGGKSDIQKAIEEAVARKDSIGGIVECRVQNLPAGLGEPFFDSVESLISHAVFSIPAIKGIEFGSGFNAARMWGSEHNDAFVSPDGITRTNHAGGINGGITNGNELVFRVAVKPTSSTSQVQHTLNFKTGQMTDLKIEGRHDTCIALRVPVVIEAVTAAVLADLMLLEQKVNRIIHSRTK
ncbi:MAG TPA: chorismate synthase [Bacteroidales bacterium]|nr:chorismate synthase [Bacteroidales bacterium]HQK36678.1 chorismate synthase [Bacteroidales bacterium]